MMFLNVVGIGNVGMVGHIRVQGSGFRIRENGAH
jgi:hypothetical protein